MVISISSEVIGAKNKEFEILRLLTSSKPECIKLAVPRHDRKLDENVCKNLNCRPQLTNRAIELNCSIAIPSQQ